MAETPRIGSRMPNAPFTPIPGKAYRGSRKRLRRITLRGNWSVWVCVFAAIFLLMLFVGIPWLIRHPPAHQRHPTESGAVTR